MVFLFISPLAARAAWESYSSIIFTWEDVGTMLLDSELIVPPMPGYRLVWHDEFDGTVLDDTKWNLACGIRRDAVNVPETVRVENGYLNITTYTDCGVHYTGFVDTAGKYQPTFGYIEARICFQPSPGEWGAFWLQSPTMGNPMGNPAEAGTEIDIVEHRRVNANEIDISNQYSSAIHWDGYGINIQSRGSGFIPNPPGDNLSNTWHTFALQWTNTGYTFYMDGIALWYSNEGISNRSEFIRLTCEVQDDAWAGHIPAMGYGSLAQSTTHLLVDWVRVWQL